jgi:hypothetical protein
MSPAHPLPDLQAVAGAIAQYLAQHPQAVDTAPGIQRWWLLPQFGEVSLEIVEDALAMLERQGTIRRLEPPGSPATWGLAAPGTASH